MPLQAIVVIVHANYDIQLYRLKKVNNTSFIHCYAVKNTVPIAARSNQIVACRRSTVDPQPFS